MLNKKKNNKGFTLVELLVVIAIIGVLAVVAVPALFKNIEKSKVASLTADINAVRSASLAYYSDTNTYPAGDIVASGADIQNMFGGNLENISNPFKSESYKLDGTVGSGNLTLTIKLPDNSKLSANSVTKIKESLGSLVASNGDVTQNSIMVTLLKAN